MGINDFANIIKRQGRYGLPATLTDTATTDILSSINVRRKQIWSYWNWSWVLEQLAIPIIVNQTQYTVVAKSGNPIDRITDLIPQDASVVPAVWGPPLDELERQDFFTWFAAQPQNTPDIPAKYVNIGMDANQRWQIILAPAPAQAFTMSGYAKKKLATYTIADINANTPMDYFPDGVVEFVLIDGCLSDIFHIQGQDVESARLDTQFNAKLLGMKVGQDNASRDDSGIVQTPPPPMRWKARMRNKSGTGIF